MIRTIATIGAKGMASAILGGLSAEARTAVKASQFEERVQTIFDRLYRSVFQDESRLVSKQQRRVLITQDLRSGQRDHLAHIVSRLVAFATRCYKARKIRRLSRIIMVEHCSSARESISSIDSFPRISSQELQDLRECSTDEARNILQKTNIWHSSTPLAESE